MINQPYSYKTLQHQQDSQFEFALVMSVRSRRLYTARQVSNFLNLTS